MRKLYLKIFLFGLPLLVLILFFPIEKRLKYQGLENDCFNHGIWIHDRIFNNDKPIDIAFLGSSITLNGINDELIENKLEANGDKCVNLGYCRNGRNICYTILKDILKNKKLKTLVLEVRLEEDRYSHPIFPHIADHKDVYLPPPLFNRDIFSDMYTSLTYSIELAQDKIFKSTKITPVDEADFGFATHPDTASSELLQKAKEKRSKPPKAMSQFERSFYSKYPKAYLDKIYELSAEHGFDIYFLYMPDYGSYFEKPNEYNTYSEYGTVIIPPMGMFQEANYRFDENHFNNAGADKFSTWLAEKIKELER